MNRMDRQLRDLLNAAAGEPPHQVTVEAVRRRVTRHRATQYLGAAAAVAVIAIIAVIAPTGIGARGHSPGPSAAGQSLPAVPAAVTFLGVFENGPGQGPPGYGPIEEFAKAAGEKPNLIGYYSGWFVPFALSFADSMHRHGGIPLVQILPVGVSVSAIASGSYDGYLSAYAQAVRAYGQPVVIGFGPEMNANWWSYGYTHTPPATFVAAWRHIVTLFRALGADNVTWLWTIAAEGRGTAPISTWWPGANYVTWVGIDGFYLKPSDAFPSLFGPTITQVRSLTLKPILLSETGVARDANQFANILNLFNGVAHYGLLGLVWLDNGQWRIEDSALAERAFQAEASRLRQVQP
jgi:Glycosyl hydrolase family 26